MAGEGKTKSVFQGFSSPNYTQVPDQLIDELMPDLSEVELKVLLYIIRRTFGFKRDSDNISLRQLSEGIVTKNGQRLDRGTGLSKSGVTKALVSLRRRGILIRSQNSDSIRGSTPTTYRLRMSTDPVDVIGDGDDFEETGLSTGEDTPVHAQRHPLSSSEDPRVLTQGQALSTAVDTQETVVQETDNRETDRIIEDSKGNVINFDVEKLRVELGGYIEDFAREFNDEATLRSSVTRAVNIYLQADVEMDVYIDSMYIARARTKEHSASITKQAASGRAGVKNRMAFFFSVLVNLLGVEETTRQSS